MTHSWKVSTQMNPWNILNQQFNFYSITMAREHRPWNSDSESSESVVMSEDTDQVIIESLSTEIQTLKKIIKLLLEKDKEKSQRIKDLQNIIMTRTGNDTTGKVLTFL